MARHLCFYNNDTLLQDNSEPGYFTEFTVPGGTNLIVCYDDDYKITCNIRVTASSNQDIINYQFGTDSALFLLKSLQNYTQNQTVRAQITVSNIAKDSNNLEQDIQNYLQNCGVGSGSSIDFSTIVTALNSIATALSALTNLSNLSNLSQLANIITAINNKDNQTDLVNELRFIFTTSQSRNTYRYLDGFNNFSVFKSANSGNDITSSSNANRVGIRSVLQNISNKLSFVNDSVANANSTENVNKSFFEIFDVLQNIETKLEQNLPFATLAQVDVVTDYTQVVKGVGKNE